MEAMEAVTECTAADTAVATEDMAATNTVVDTVDTTKLVLSAML